LARILCIETATEVCSVCLAQDGAMIRIAEDQQNKHIELLTLLIQDVMQGLDFASLDAIAVSAGPGSYTSLRVGVSVAKGLCFALNKPLIAVPTLLALGQASIAYHGELQDIAHIVALPLLDARRDEVCMAVMEKKDVQTPKFFQNFVSNKMFETIALERAVGPQKPVLLLSGNGAKKCKNVHFDQNVVYSALEACSASYLVPIAEEKFYMFDFQELTSFEPIYFKPPQVTQSKKITF
jgi:tRNA threonylcarbamoyladenosine biosynthesis protein TsaB